MVQTLQLEPERLVEELVHAVGALADARDVVGARLLADRVGAALEQLGEAGDDGQRRAQVVHQVGQGVAVGVQRWDRVGSESAISPRSSAMAIAWTRLRACSLRMTLRTCVRTVSTETPSSSPIASAVRPSAMRWVIWRSRGESCGRREVERSESRIRSSRGST